MPPKTPQKSRRSQTTPNPKIGPITLSATAFAGVLDAVLYPNPDDSGPLGPGGPVMQRWMWAALNPQPLPPGPDPYARLAWAALNPQPLPPGPDPYARLAWAALNPQPLPPGPDLYARLGWIALNPQPLPPGPDPYRSAFAARSVIEGAAAQHQLAEILGNEQSQRSIIIVGGKVRDIVDEWCGTAVPGHRGPRPHAVALLAAGVQFQKAADTLRNNPLQSVFASAAERLFKTGLSRIEQQSE